MISTKQLEELLRKAAHKVQLGFMRCRDFIDKEEADKLRKKVTKRIYSKKFKRFY